MTARLLATASAVMLMVAGCGEDSDEEEPPPRPSETVDAVADLPPGWTVHVNRSGGFAFGIPHGWEADDRGVSTLVRSFDRLVAISITPDRSGEALEVLPQEFATHALAALPGYEAGLEPGDPHPFRHQYDAASVAARATATESGLDQRLEVIVVQRDRMAVVTAVIAAADDPRSRPDEQLATQVVRTLRTRPPAVGSAADEGPVASGP